MRKSTLKKYIFYIVILIFLFPIFGQGVNSDIDRNVTNNNFDPPDIKMLGVYGRWVWHVEPYFITYFRVKNIGGSTRATIHFKISEEHFNSTSFRFEHFNTYKEDLYYGMNAGKIMDIEFSNGVYNYHPAGFIRFKCHASIVFGEINILNNNYLQIFYNFLGGFWFLLWHRYTLLNN